MKRYHGQAASPTFPPSVKATPDARDRWRFDVAADPTLGARALRVALGLLGFVNRDGLASVGIARLARELGTDSRAIERGLAELRAAGHLERTEGAGVRGRGGVTARTRLIHKPPVAATGTAGTEPPVETARTPGRNEAEPPVTVAGQTLLTHKPNAAGARGLEAASSTAEAERARTAMAGGKVLGMLENLETSPRAEPRPVRDAVLAAIRQKFGMPAKRAVTHHENVAEADGRGADEARVLYAK